MNDAERQAALYQGVWADDPTYGTAHRDVVDTVVHRIGPHLSRVLAGPASVVVDFGAGDGRFLKHMHLAGLAHRCHGIDVHNPVCQPYMRWSQVALWDADVVGADYVISTDTLEHMPPEQVPAVLARIAACAPHGFLRISTKQDIYGTERGLHLHETVQPPEWWLARCGEAGITPTAWKVYPGSAVEVWW